MPKDITIPSGEVTLAAQTFGNAGDPPVVLIMGATASMLWWPESLCQGLADRSMFVIRYDNRDTGKSTSVPLGEARYAVEDMAGDLIALLNHLQLPAAHIVGMSLGGLIGQIAAIAYPDRLMSLSLIASEPLDWHGPPLPTISPAFLDHFDRMASLDWQDGEAVSAFLLEIARLSAGQRFPFDPAREIDRIEAEMARASDMSSAFNHGSVALRDDWTDRMAQIHQPVLVVHGSEDPILPVENGRAIASTIPGARLHVLEGIGHELPMEIIPELIAILSEFLSADMGNANPD